MKITVETIIYSTLDVVWACWSNPEDIKQWNAASDDWHTTRSTVDFKVGGKFVARMEAKNGSSGFDFVGQFTKIVNKSLIEYRMEDNRQVSISFEECEDWIKVVETFDAETENPAEQQRQGWQSILENFARHVESL